ncbi:hypothetical protein [Rhodococcoides fascians]|uniref:hypothetical protein n=1 Tax=Rhodococcoides fascians TaxID=1828 RepID=UPI00055D0F2E|nr:hypothetical protein [Rhodococcus fascians]
MDDIERAVIRSEGFDPDDPAVIAALDRVTVTLRRYCFDTPRPSKALSWQSGPRAGVYVIASHSRHR